MHLCIRTQPPYAGCFLRKLSIDLTFLCLFLGEVLGLLLLLIVRHRSNRPFALLTGARFWVNSMVLAVDRDADQHGHAEQTDSELAGTELAHHFDDVVVGGDADLVHEGVDLVLDGIQGSSWVRAFLLASCVILSSNRSTQESGGR